MDIVDFSISTLGDIIFLNEEGVIYKPALSLFSANLLNEVSVSDHDKQRIGFPVSSAGKETNVRLLLDSSIVLMSNRTGRFQAYHYKYNSSYEKWEKQESSLSHALNSLVSKGTEPLKFQINPQNNRVLAFLKLDKSEKYVGYACSYSENRWSNFKPINLELRSKDFEISPSLNYILFLNKNGDVQSWEYQNRRWTKNEELPQFQNIKNISNIGVLSNRVVCFTQPWEKGESSNEASVSNVTWAMVKIDNKSWSEPFPLKGIFPTRLSISSNSKNLISEYLCQDPNGVWYGGWDFDALVFEVPEILKVHLQEKETIKKMIVEESSNLSELPETSTTVKPTGVYYALLIGNSNYDVDELDLNKPVEDMRVLKKVLIENYQFEIENIIEVENATRSDIFEKLYELRKKIKPDDNLLIFYAGHGHWDKQVEQGYWWPIDADPNNPSDWLSNSDLKEQIRGINTAHTLLISDACFSGGIFKTRGTEELRGASVDKQLLYRMPSRRAITSGTLSSVPDNSVFHKYLIKNLTENPDKFMSSQELFSRLRISVMNNSLTVPQNGVIMNSGDEGGDFIFIRRED